MAFHLGILSDIHYASGAEQARGRDYEMRGIGRTWLRFAVRAYRRYFWLRDPFSHNHLVDRFIAADPGWDCVVANGDYSCDSVFIGASDPAAGQSIAECLGKLRGKFGARLRVNCGDHELGKMSFFGGTGGMRLASFDRARELGVEPFWQMAAGRYVLLGVTSSLVALPVFERDTLPEERAGWQRHRAEHLEAIRKAFEGMSSDARILLFCHDPSALPFLGQEPAVAARFPQIEQTVIGHLHSPLIWWKARRLSGLPRISFLGHTARRMSTALREGRQWRPFKVRLCPSLAGIELLKDGGFYSAEIDPAAKRPALFRFHALSREA